MRQRIGNVRAIPDMSNDDYHSQPYNSLSASRLKLFNESPPEYHITHVLGEGEESDTVAKAFGRFQHHVVLESKPVSIDNCLAGTVGYFISCETPDRDADAITEHGEYWFVTDKDGFVPGVIVKTSQWGAIGKNQWRHEDDVAEAAEYVGSIDAADEHDYVAFEGEWEEAKTPSTKPFHSDEYHTLWFQPRNKKVIRKSRYWGLIDVMLDSPAEWYHPLCQNNISKPPVLTGYCAYQDMLLDGDEFHAIPPGLGIRSTKAFKEWSRKHRKFDQITFADWKLAITVRKEIRLSGAANYALFSNHEHSGVEYTLVGLDLDTQLEIRCRFDRFFVEGDRMVIVDLKTTRDPDPKTWRKQCETDRLHVQAYIMLQMAVEWARTEFPDVKNFDYQYVAVGKKRSVRVEVMRLVPDWIEMGENDYASDVDFFKQCDQTNIWRSRTYGIVVDIDVPGYLIKRKMDARGSQGVSGTPAAGFYED